MLVEVQGNLLNDYAFTNLEISTPRDRDKLKNRKSEDFSTILDYSEQMVPDDAMIDGASIKSGKDSQLEEPQFYNPGVLKSKIFSF